MSDETRMHNLLGKFFDKNAGANRKSAEKQEKEPEKPEITESEPEIPASAVNASEQPDDEEAMISDELFADILADLLADDGEEAPGAAPAAAEAAEEVDAVAEAVEAVEAEAAVTVAETVAAVTEAVEAAKAEAEPDEGVNAAEASEINEAAEAVTEAVEAAAETADAAPDEITYEAASADEELTAEAPDEAADTLAAAAAEETAEAAETDDSALEEVAAELERAFGADEAAEEKDSDAGAIPQYEIPSDEKENKLPEFFTDEDVLRNTAEEEEAPAAEAEDTADADDRPDEAPLTFFAAEETAADGTDAGADTAEETAADGTAVVAADGTDGEKTEDEVPALDPEDAMLMSALGYADGEIQQAASARRDPSVLNAGKMYSDLDNAFAYDGCEYRSKEQNQKILSNYADEQKLMYVRMAGTAIFAILLFIYDIFGKKFGGPLSAVQFPVVNILISLQLLLLCAVFSFRSLGQGLKGIFNARPVNDSVTAGVVAFTVLYDIILAIAAPSAFTLYNFPAAFCLCLTVAADELTLLREIRTFRRLADFDTVCTLEKIVTPEEAGKTSSTYRLRRGSFASNYFRRVNKCGFPPVFIYVILFGTALAFVLFFISLASSRSEDGHAFVDALNVFITVIQFALPSFAIVSYVIPFFFMIGKKIDDNAVILHESDTRDYDKVGTIVLDEQDIFGEGSIKINGIMNCNPGSDYFDTLAATSAIFDKVGGTISYAFRTVAGDAAPAAKAEKIKVCDGGVEADVGGVHYVIGTAEYLGRKWISCPDSDSRKYLSAVSGGFVLYIAADGVTSLRLNMQYSLDSMSAGLIGSLSEKKIRVILRCQDPFITSDMVSVLAGLNELRLAVLRTDGPDEDDGAFPGNSEETVDGGLIADGVEWLSAIKAAESCGLYRKWNKLGFYISSGLIILGALLACFLGGFGTVVGMPSFYIVLFQILSVIPTAVMSRLVFD